MIDLVHGRMMLRERCVEAFPGMEELRHDGAELGLTGERQHGLVDQNVEMTEHRPSRGDECCPRGCRDPPLSAPLLASSPCTASMSDRTSYDWSSCENGRLQRREGRRLALAVVTEGVLEGRGARLEETAPGVGRAEEPNPGQDLALHVELERLIVAGELVVAARRVLVSVDGIDQGVAECSSTTPSKRVVLAVDEQLPAVLSSPRDCPGHPAAVRLVGLLRGHVPVAESA